MHALKTFSMVITFAALSLSGSAARATGENSFVAKAKLNGFNLVPPLLSSSSGAITLTFFKPKPTTDARTIALVVKRNPWGIRARTPGDQFFLDNIRLYFGQQFANGQPIATLCDDAIDTLKCNPDPDVPPTDEVSREGEFDLSSIQFQVAQIRNAGTELIDGDRRLCTPIRCPPDNLKSGFNTIRMLIQRGLIYVVFNSEHEAELRPDGDPDRDLDPETDDIIYTPPGYDLSLKSVDAADGLSNAGRNLVIVALVGTDLHIRIFDANGKRVVDKAENELISGETLTALKKQLNPLPDESGLSQEQKQKFIRDATSIAGHTPPPASEFVEGELRGTLRLVSP